MRWLPGRVFLLVLFVGVGISAGCGERAGSDPDRLIEPDSENQEPGEDVDPCADPGDLEPMGMPSLGEHENPHHHHEDDTNEAERFDEHVALFDLVPYEDATHVAVRDGHWCNPTTWHEHELPGEGARVVIQEGREVVYDLFSDAALATVRVDGRLVFDPEAESQMVVETLVVDLRGELQIGTAENPVEEGTVKILFVDDGDLDPAKDPMLLGRGLISHGAARIHGAEKLVHWRVSEDPMAGDTSLLLAEEPRGWRVGDTLVVAGTTYSG